MRAFPSLAIGCLACALLAADPTVAPEAERPMKSARELIHKQAPPVVTTDLLDKTTPDNFERFARAVKLAPEVLECHMVAGGFDYLVKARLADMRAYRRFLGETLLSMPGVRETRTYAVMEEIKRDAPLPVG